MAVFGQSRIFRKRGGQAARPRAAVRLMVAWVLAGIAGLMLLAGRIEPALFDGVRNPMAGIVAPVAGAFSFVMGPVNRAVARLSAAAGQWGEVEQLRAENGRLAALAARADLLEQENIELKRLARFAGAAGVPRLTARVVAASPGALARTLMIDAGRTQGVREGYPVVVGDGLIGRVVQAHEVSATVRLLSDRLSRVPVFIGRRQARGLLTGTGGGSPRLEFVAGDVAITAGDIVTTSGLGGVFPRGLAVGVVVAEGAGWRVSLAAGDAAPFTVGVLQVEVPSSDAGEALNKRGERDTAGTRLKALVK